MDLVGFVPVRLNSKRVASKSVRPLGGRPLFCWMAEMLDEVGIPIHIYASKTDELARHLDFHPKNVRFTTRPERLDGDDIRGIDIYREFAATVPADGYLLCHCTSPFLRLETVRKVLQAVQSGRANCSLTARRIQTFTWFEGRPVNFALPRVQTQLLKPLFVETSAAYCYRSEILSAGDRSDLRPEIVELEWPEDEDLDTELDFLRCDLLSNWIRSRNRP